MADAAEANSSQLWREERKERDDARGKKWQGMLQRENETVGKPGTVYIHPANDTGDQDNKTQMIPPMLQESTRCVKKQMIRRMIQQSLA